MSLCHKVQFILSNLSFSVNIGVDPVDDIVIFCLVISAVSGVRDQ